MRIPRWAVLVLVPLVAGLLVAAPALYVPLTNTVAARNPPATLWPGATGVTVTNLNHTSAATSITLVPLLDSALQHINNTSGIHYEAKMRFLAQSGSSRTFKLGISNTAAGLQIDVRNGVVFQSEGSFQLVPSALLTSIVMQGSQLDLGATTVETELVLRPLVQGSTLHYRVNVTFTT